MTRLAGLEGVASAFAATRDGFDALLRDRGLRKTSPETTGASLLRGAYASAVLAGSGSTFERFEAGEQDDIAGAALRMSTELLGLAPLIARAPVQAFARLHVLAAKSVVDVNDLGRPVRSADRLHELAKALMSPTDAPAMVVAAVAHAEIVTANAFVSHNDLIARAVERLILVQRGVDPTSLTVPEAGHLAWRQEYQARLAAYEEPGLAGVHAWLLYAAKAFASGAEASPLAG